MIRTILLASAALALTTNAYAAAPKKAARPAAAATLPASNPFAKPSTLPFQAPDFSKIKDTDYLPAIIAGMAEQKREVLAIANNPAPATFNNTIVALERSGALLERAGLVRRDVRGRNHYCQLQAARLADADRWLSFYQQFWTGRFAALDRVVEAKGRSTPRRRRRSSRPY